MTFSLKNSLLVLRQHRLNHIPPARQSAELLAEAGLPVAVVEFGQAEQTTMTDEAGLPTWRLSSAWAQRVPSKLRAPMILAHALWILIRRCQTERPALIETHGPQEQFLAWSLNRLFGIPYVAHLHEIYDAKQVRNLARLLIRCEGFFLRRAQFTIFPSAERAAIYQRRYRLPSKPTVVFNTPRRRTPQRQSNFYSRQGIPAGSKVILYIGGLAPLNATEAVVKAAAHLAEGRFLVFAGWGDESFIQRLKKLSQEQGTSERVKFVGPVKDKWNWIDNADLGLCLYQGVELRSRYNAGPSNKLFEFISAGRPVITNHAPDFQAIVEKDSLGLTVDPTRPEDIATAIETLCRRSDIGQKALALHQSRYNYETQFQPALEKFQAFFPEVRPSQTKAA